MTNGIGITVQGRPRVGIIHKPFLGQGQNAQRTYVGSTEAGLFYFDQSLSDRSISSPTYVSPFAPSADSNTESEEGKPFQPQLVSCDDMQHDKMMERVFRDIMPMTVNRVKGTGNQFLHLTKERSDFFLNLLPRYSMTDICASEAIYSSRFGILTDAKQKPLFYDSSRRAFGLFNGVVAARDSNVYLSAQQTYENNSGRTLAESQTEIRR